jgi:hypothetical protein
MAVNNARAEFLKAVKPFAKEAVAASKEKVAGFTSGDEVVKILELSTEERSSFPAKVSKIRYGVDKNKAGYFSFDFVLTGENAGLPIQEYLGFPTGEKGKDQRERNLKSAMIFFDRLGYDLEGVTQAKINDAMMDAADEVTSEKPSVLLSLQAYAKKDETHGVNIRIVSMTNDNSVGEPEDGDEEDIDLEALGALADEEDADAQETLTQLLADAGLDVNDYPTWAEGVEAYNAQTGEAEEEEAEEEAEEEVEETEVPEDYDEVVEVSDEDAEYYESCVGYPGSFVDEGGDDMTATCNAYDRETHTLTMEGDDGTIYNVEATTVSFE